MKLRHRTLLVAACQVLFACSGDGGGGPADEGPSRGRDRDGTASGDADESPDAGDGVDDADESPQDAPVEAGGDDAATLCTPGTRACLDNRTSALCRADGSARDPSPCPTGQLCFSGDGSCHDAVCQPGSSECIDLDRYRVCRDDGLDWDPPVPCDDATFCSEGGCSPLACLPSVMFAVDGSSSMTGEFDAIHSSVAAVIAANPEVAFGLSMFPVALGCSIGDGTPGLFGAPAVNWPHVEIQADAGPLMDRWFAENDAAGGATPLASTIEWFAEHTTDVWGPVTQNGYLVVLSEGADTCISCDDGDDACVASELADVTRRLTATGIRTYVIGYRYGDAPEALNAIAENGGTPVTEFIYAGSEETLTDAFQAILDDVKECQ